MHTRLGRPHSGEGRLRMVSCYSNISIMPFQRGTLHEETSFDDPADRDIGKTALGIIAFLVVNTTIEIVIEQNKRSNIAFSLHTIQNGLTGAAAGTLSTRNPRLVPWSPRKEASTAVL